MEKYIIAVDQSTQLTKAMLFDEEGTLCKRVHLPHRQMINKAGWVEHDPEEIYQNLLQTIYTLIEESKINVESIVGIGISNQRETAVVWNKETKKPVYNAIVWQCKRGEDICQEIARVGLDVEIKEKTGLQLSPYFTAAKIAWILNEVDGANTLMGQGKLGMGTMDSWLLYQLTEGKSYKTDYSNASRTQLFNIHTLQWDTDICKIFGIDEIALPKVCDSNHCFGMTNLGGFLKKEVPIHSMLGDSHGALFGQGCLKEGMIKATYGTGSSVMMNVGSTIPKSNPAVVTSLAWGMDQKVMYVLEGNINYAGAVIAWMENELGLIASAKETATLAKASNSNDQTYFVPAFSGLGSPYWKSEAKGILMGITRTTKKEEFVRAGLDCIAYQVTDIVKEMEKASGEKVKTLCVDGGPCGNDYLMQFQSDMVECNIEIPEREELSGIGVAYMTGIALGIYDKDTIFSKIQRTTYRPQMKKEERDKKYRGWKQAVAMIL